MQILKFSFLLFCLTLFALPTEAAKKLLPQKIKGPRTSVIYAYDDQNRIISITQNNGSMGLIQTIHYDADDMGYSTNVKFFESKDDMEGGDLTSSESQSIRYIENTKSRVQIEMYSNITTRTLTPSGRVKEMRMQPNDYDEATSIDRPIIIGYKYDHNNNIVGVDFPNKTPFQVNREIKEMQMIEHTHLRYDDKNGIFKHLNPVCFMIDIASPLSICFFGGNNLMDISPKKSDDDDDMADGAIVDFSFKYNKDGYPEEMESQGFTFALTYIEAH